MLAYTFYETDGRVMRYAEALADAGVEVEAIVLRRPGQQSEEFVNGVRVFRIQQREKNERARYIYLLRIVRFFVRSTIAVSLRHLRRPYDLIHVHSVPDFEVFAALLPKVLGARVILDIHDIVPEFYSAKFGVSHRSLVFRALTLLERLSGAFADHVIIANDLWLERLVTRSVESKKCSALINYPDMSIFFPGLRTRQVDRKFVVLYPGTLNWHQGLDIAVRAMAKIVDSVPGMELHIYGEGPTKLEIEKLVEELDLSTRVFIRPSLPLREIAPIMANADLGIVPKRADGFGGEAFSTKILEFMALGVPLVVASTKIDQYYFDDTVVKFFCAGDEVDLGRALVEAYRDRSAIAQQAENALRFASSRSWTKKKEEYLRLVRRLIGDRA